MDETTDLLHRERVAIVIRYCTLDLNTSERLNSLTDADKVTDETLADILINTTQKYKFDTSKLVARSYDGAAAMTGQHRRVQATMKRVAPKDDYNHCRSHSSKKALSDTRWKDEVLMLFELGCQQ